MVDILLLRDAAREAEARQDAESAATAPGWKLME
jgi:hypothetical protein